MKTVILNGILLFFMGNIALGQLNSFRPGETWNDVQGNVINAHGGGILYHDGTYYWFGEKRGRSKSEGVNVYSSKDLYNWKLEALALSQDEDSTSDIAKGCLMERPKVIYNAKTKKFVMWFHLELRGKGYKAARAGVAVSENVTGPYRFVKSFRPNGNMSRDMTLFVDDDGSAYQVYAADENYDLRIAKLSEDFLSATAEDTLLFRAHREAPALFKLHGVYYLITSGCTGWAPNKATLHTAHSLWGPWQLNEQNPMQGPDADVTFGAQSTYVLPVPGSAGRFIFIADKWNPKNLIDSRYIWLPVSFAVAGTPYVQWIDEWKLNGMK